MFKNFKMEFQDLLALIVMGLFALVMVVVGVSHIEVSTDLKSLLGNIVMLVIGYYFGSSVGSKKKDAALMPPPEDKP